MTLVNLSNPSKNLVLLLVLSSVTARYTADIIYVRAKLNYISLTQTVTESLLVILAAVLFRWTVNNTSLRLLVLILAISMTVLDLTLKRLS